jgi:two-component system response regulator FixJ
MSDTPYVHVLDDDEAVRDSIRFLLTSAGFQVTVHESSHAFLAGLSSIANGCVITDVRMPEIGGIDLLRKVQEQNPELPVIVITGHADVPLAVEAMKIGAFEFIEKPFDDTVLLAAVRAAIGREEKLGQRRNERAGILQRLESLSHREGKCWMGWWQATPWTIAPTAESARAPSRSIAPMS